MKQNKSRWWARSIPLITATALVTAAGATRMASTCLAQPPLPIVAQSVSVGIPGTQLFAGLGGQGGQQSTNSNVVVIGASSYISLQPTASDLLSLETTTSTNVITLRVYSRESLSTLVAEDSTAINGRTFAAVTFPAAAGALYDVQLTGLGSVTLTYKLGLPPSFTQTPTNRIAAEGCAVTLRASATGRPDPTYQWSFNSLDLPGETNATLTISDARPSKKGKYRVRAKNFLDTVISPEADLDVVPAVVGPPSQGNNRLFQFTLTGVPGQSYTIEASTNLIIWTGVTTSTAGTNGALLFSDAQTPSFTARFFRIRTPCP